MRTGRLAYAELAAAMALAGSTVVAGKWLVAEWPVFLLNGLRLWIAAGILWFWLMRVEGVPRLTRRDWLLLALQAFAGVFLFNICMLHGLVMTTASSAGIIVSTTPAVIGLLSWLFLRERMSAYGTTGILCATLGMWLAGNTGEGGTSESGGWLGPLLVFAAVCGEALFAVLGSASARSLSPLAQSAVVALLGGAMFLPFSLFQAASFPFAAVSMADWLAVAYFALAGSVFSYLLWYRGIAKVRAGTAGAFVGVLPVTVLVLSAAVLEEPLTWRHVAAAACVLAGIAFMSRHDTSRKRTAVLASRDFPDSSSEAFGHRDMGGDVCADDRRV